MILSYVAIALIFYFDEPIVAAALPVTMMFDMAISIKFAEVLL